MAIMKTRYGGDHQNVATALSNLAQLLIRTEKYEEAEPLYREVLRIDKKNCGDNHPEVAKDLHNIAGCLIS